VLGVHNLVYRSACGILGSFGCNGGMIDIMAAAIVQPDVLEMTIREIVNKVVPPKGVRLRRIYFDNDHSGDPSVYIVYGVSKKIPLTKSRVRSLSALSNAVADPIWDLPSGPIPYVRFEDVR
jgi:hypothetical protein